LKRVFLRGSGHQLVCPQCVRSTAESAMSITRGAPAFITREAVLKKDVSSATQGFLGRFW